MKALQLKEFGTTQITTVKPPTLKPDEVLIKVHASSINPVDWKIASGMLAQLVQQPLPLTLGWDMAGEVVETGNGSRDFLPGDRVFTMKEIGKDGCLAEYCVVNRHHLAMIPEHVRTEHAAVLPMALLTSWQALIGAGNLHRNQRLFIQAGAGGVGHMAIQLAKVMQAHVIVATSSRNVDFAYEVGADEVLDYQSQDVYQWLVDNPVDIVLESLHGDDQVKCVAALKPKGRLISISGLQPETVAAAEKANVKAEFVFVQPNGTQLHQAAELLETAQIMPHISQTIPFEEIEHGYAINQQGRTRGKILVTFPPFR
ncbi:Alcohol dehydrogenase [Vibrio scophthalmi]|uniref:NADP-dependent oxidoreductase n=1 Tax=Vibrio scophthalmi TaxID=45658 RepID=UPI0008095FB2|nr:NADP-dependent oxidoreductase [Vibrio scophthalmi]ANS85483.1 Alcohol dehydrogenase [Vibrio scophthalmi]